MLRQQCMEELSCNRAKRKTLDQSKLFDETVLMIRRPRKRPANNVQTAVLKKSARRCALCFHLNGILEEKRGQLAHVYHDRSNDAEDNLVFLCMDHHSLYDSTTSQHKNYTGHEVRDARTRLYEAIADGQHRLAQGSHGDRSSDADRKRLAALLELMSKSGSIEFLRNRNFAGWSFDWNGLDGIETMLSCRGPEHEFLNDKLERPRHQFLDACNDLITLLVTNTFPVETRGDYYAVPEELEAEKPELFRERVEEIHRAADALCDAYDGLVRTARKTLCV